MRFFVVVTARNLLRDYRLKNRRRGTYTCFRHFYCVCICMCPQARYNWKLTPSISSFFFNNYISRASREWIYGVALSRQCISYLPVLAMSPILISRRAIWTLPQYMAKYFRYLPVGCEIDNPRPFNHARDFRDTKSFVPSSNLLLYITTQVYTGIYIQFSLGQHRRKYRRYVLDKSQNILPPNDTWKQMKS